MIVADITMSLDGFVTGPNPGPGNGLGDGAGALHAWAFDAGSEADARVLAEAVQTTGAVIMGRHTFDVVDAPGGWREDVGYGAGHAATPPCFVVTHEPPDVVRLADRFTFVTDGVGTAIERALPAAGARDVVVMGGADVMRQALELGLVERLRIHLSPLLLGAGTRLFNGGGSPRPLTIEAVQPSRNATHLTYRLSCAPAA